MNSKAMLKLSPVAAAVMLALGSAAHAAAPAANALPGAFLSNQATTAVTYTINTSNAATIVVPSAGTLAGSGNTVLQFGGATSATVSNAITPTVTPTSGVTTVAGFNIGSAATLTFHAGGTGANVLVSDQTGQASNIDGTIVTTGTNLANLFIANPNGVVVGGGASLTAGDLALLGYQADEADFVAHGQVTVGVSPSLAATLTSPSQAGTPTATANGTVTVSDGATVNAGYLLVAGAGQVNVGGVHGTPPAIAIAAGAGATATSTAMTVDNTLMSAGAVANVGGAHAVVVASMAAAGGVNTSNTVHLNNATVGGTLTNSGTLSLGGVNNVSALVNSVSVAISDAATSSYGSITNNAYATIAGVDNVATLTNNGNATVATNVSVGSATNSANLDLTGALNLGGTFANAGKATLAGTITATSSAAAVSNTGTLDASSTGLSTVNTVTLGSFANTGTIYDGGKGVGVTAGSINLGGTVAKSSTASSVGAISLVAETGDLVGTAGITTPSTVSLTAVKGNVNYTGAITATGAVTAAATTGAVTLGAVNASTASLSATAGNGNLTLGGNVTDTGATLKATGGSIYVNGNITDAGSVSATADNQIMVNGTVSATTGTVSLTTNKVWTGAYNLGVVIQPSGGVNATGVTVNAADNMLQYGTLAATTIAGFTFTGNSYYQGAGAAINTSVATFNFGSSTTASAAIAGGIVAGSANPQPSGAFFNAVMVGGSNATTGVTLNVTAANLGTAAQNVNLMGIGDTTLNTGTSTSTLFGPNGSAVINTSFVPSNLFVRAQGGNLAIAANDGVNFYWPGLVYASTVKAGMVSTVDTTKTITVGAGTAAFSNALPYQATGGAGIYLMTGKINVGDITTNTNSNINVLNSLQVAGLNLYTAAAPTGLVLTYSATLPAANVVNYTPPAN